MTKRRGINGEKKWGESRKNVRRGRGRERERDQRK